MPRFVILEHRPGSASNRPLHWDLMLEAGSVLQTWALESQPAPGTSVTAEQLADHRLDYLEYEGPVSAGRGSVRRWDQGEYQWVDQRIPAAGIQLFGERIKCRAVITVEEGSAACRIRFS